MKAYQLKIMIKNSHPPIWRRCIIPAGITFSQLSILLNEIMGWTGYHLSDFEFLHSKIRIFEDLDDGFFEPFADFGILDSKKTYINEYMENNKWFSYVYDFGDYWNHRVDIEKVIEDYESAYPKVLKYKGNCPPEDCGGIYGYYEGGFEEEAMEYDIDNINGMLEHVYRYKYGEGEVRSQQELMEAASKSEAGFKASEAAVNTEKPLYKNFVVSPEKREEDLLQIKELMEELLRMYREHQVDMADILNSFNLSDLKDIAKENRLRGISSLRKTELVERLKEWLLMPDIFEANLYNLRDEEINALESLIKCEDEYMIHDLVEECLFTKLLDIGYLGLRSDDIIEVPPEVGDTYNLLNTKEFHLKRKRMNWVFDCYFFAESFYGVTPLDIFLKLVNLHREYSYTKDSLRMEMMEVTGYYKYFVFNDSDEIVPSVIAKDNGIYRNLEELQSGKEFYIPSYDELTDFIEHGYFSKDKNTCGLRRLLEVSFKVDNVEAEDISAEIQRMIALGCKLQDIVVFLEDEDVIFKSEADISKTMACINQMWNNTRMLWNRGFTPFEMSEKNL